MSPQEAVSRLAEILAARGEFTEDDIYAAMAAAGIPDPVADRAYKFTQIAWGRVLLDGLGIQFAPDYLCFNAAGDLVESGLLAEQPHFVAALNLARGHRPAALPRLALMAAEVRAVNELLNSGSQAKDIATTAPALFLEAPTPAGMARARHQLTERLQRPRKPWWRFW